MRPSRSVIGGLVCGIILLKKNSEVAHILVQFSFFPKTQDPIHTNWHLVVFFIFYILIFVFSLTLVLS